MECYLNICIKKHDVLKCSENFHNLMGNIFVLTDINGMKEYSVKQKLAPSVFWLFNI